jgi:hypothetical protein
MIDNACPFGEHCLPWPVVRNEKAAPFSGRGLFVNVVAIRAKRC